MDFYSFTAKYMLSLTVLLIYVSPAFSMDDPEFSISRMVMSQTISEREPVHITNTFSSNTETVFCFLEARDIEIDTEVSIVWLYEGQEKARVILPLQKGGRWRTFSSKIVKNMKGGWSVELQEASGVVLNTVSFQIE